MYGDEEGASVNAVKLELDAPPLPLPLLGLLGQRAIRCSVLLHMRHFITSPFLSLGFPCRPNPLPVEPLRFPLPLLDTKASTGSVNQKPFPRFCRENPFPRPLVERLYERLKLRTGRPVGRRQLRLAFRY